MTAPARTAIASCRMNIIIFLHRNSAAAEYPTDAKNTRPATATRTHCPSVDGPSDVQGTPAHSARTNRLCPCDPGAAPVFRAATAFGPRSSLHGRLEPESNQPILNEFNVDLQLFPPHLPTARTGAIPPTNLAASVRPVAPDKSPRIVPAEPKVLTSALIGQRTTCELPFYNTPSVAE